jgi:hypothetical protein
MTRPPCVFGQVITSAGRLVNCTEHYSFKNNSSNVIVLHGPPQHPTTEQQSLEGLKGSQFATLSILLLDHPNSYWQANVSPQWSDWNKAIDDEVK